jgi:hypothetical protein
MKISKRVAQVGDMGREAGSVDESGMSTPDADSTVSQTLNVLT